MKKSRKNFEMARKIRKTWTINPRTRVHSTPKGKQGYTRSGNKEIEREWL